MPRQRSLLTVIRDMVQEEVRSAIQSLLGSVSGTLKPKPNNGRRRRRKTREVASRRSRSPAKGCCREDGAEEGRARIPEAEDWSPPSQASARSWASSGIEEESGINPAW